MPILPALHHCKWSGLERDKCIETVPEIKQIVETSALEEVN